MFWVIQTMGQSNQELHKFLNSSVKPHVTEAEINISITFSLRKPNDLVKLQVPLY